jgi:GNAT superfamily N-acetyltransferase
MDMSEGRMKMNIVPFRETDLEEASVLLARRHLEDRAHEATLPERFTRPDQAWVEVEKTWKAATGREGSGGGVVARESGRMIGYMIGVPKIDAVWGRSVWVELAGQAIDRSYSAEIYRDMYAALSPSWVALGCLYHVSNLPAHDRDALEAWFDLSFGKEHVYGVRETTAALDGATPVDPTLEIRRAIAADVDLAMELDLVLPAHQARAPVYAILIPYHKEEERQDVLEELQKDDWKTWLAVRDGRLVGIQLYLPAQPGQGIGALPIPDNSCFLGFAATREDEQRRGIGRLLTARGLADASETGYTTCFTDWRATNLLSSRFWTRRGWRPVVYRLSRRLDSRILWSHNQTSPDPWLMHTFSSR